MKNKINELKNRYIILKKHSEAAIKYVRNEEDIIKLNAGIVTLNLIIEDLEKIITEAND